MLAGLIDVDKLTGKGYDGNLAGLAKEVAAQSGFKTGNSRVDHGASKRQCSCGFHRGSMRKRSTGLNLPLFFTNRSQSYGTMEPLAGKPYGPRRVCLCNRSGLLSV